MKKTIGAVVPCLDKRGGIRHFLEIGNELVKRGFNYTLFTPPEAQKCAWFDFKGEYIKPKELVIRQIIAICKKT